MAKTILALVAMCLMALSGGAGERLPARAAGVTAAECAEPRKLSAGETWVDPSPHRCGHFTVDGVRLHYLDWGGSGEVVLMLHGLGTTAHMFDDLAPLLAGEYRVIALTRRGHAESDHPPGGYSIRQTTADIVALLDSVRFSRVHVIAHSIGGAEAMRLAMDHPERVGSIIYLDGLPDWSGAAGIFAQDPVTRPGPGAAFRSIDTHREWLRRMFYGFWTPALEADFRYSRPNPTANAAIRNDAFATEPQYGDVAAPSLAIVAMADVATEYPWLMDSGAYPPVSSRGSVRGNSGVSPVGL